MPIEISCQNILFNQKSLSQCACNATSRRWYEKSLLNCNECAATYKHHTFIFNLNLFALFPDVQKVHFAECSPREKNLYIIRFKYSSDLYALNCASEKKSGVYTIELRIRDFRYFFRVRKSISKTSHQQTLSCLEFLVFRTFFIAFFSCAAFIVFYSLGVILKLSGWADIKAFNFEWWGFGFNENSFNFFVGFVKGPLTFKFWGGWLQIGSYSEIIGNTRINVALWIL